MAQGKAKAKRDIILVSGMTREHTHWGKIPQALAKEPFCNQVYALDLPGCGEYWRKTGALSVRQMTQHLRQDYLRRCKGQSRPKIIVGLSLGAMAAFQWVICEPWEFTEYILINTSFGNLSLPFSRLRPKSFVRVAEAMSKRSNLVNERTILELVSNAHYDDLGLLRENVLVQKQRPVTIATALRQLFAAATFFPSVLHGLAPKGLVLASRRDHLVNYRCSQRIAEHYGLELALHPTAGHDLPLDDPSWVLGSIKRHCS